MKKDNLLYIEDINNAIDWIIDDYLKDFSFEDLIGDNKTQDAVIRQISVIGEAMSKLEQDFIKRHPELPARESISMRNILVHDYDNVDLEKLWKTVQKDLPELKQTVSKILSENS